MNPYDCPTPALYILAHQLKPSFMDLHPEGARVISSRVPVKPGFFATIKSCNYLPNALMKKESVDAGADFSLSFDEESCLAEGATENAGILGTDGCLRVPTPERILAGTTMHRAMLLAKSLIDKNMLKSVEVSRISKGMILDAREMFIFGTTPDVTAVIQFDGRPVGDGRPGPIFRELNRLVLADIRTNAAVLTPAF